MLLVLLGANVAVFLLMAVSTHHFSFDSGELLLWGGNLGYLSMHGQAWRLLTALFVHANLGHIFGNMVLLLITGGILERKLRSGPFLAAYLCCGLAGSVLSASMHPQVVSIGASGAIAGLMGCLLVLKLAGRAAEVSASWMWQVILLNGVYSFAPSVDGVAHLGGFVAGLIVGVIAAVRRPVREDEIGTG